MTLKYLDENELEKIQSIHTSDLEASIAAIKGAIELEKYQISNLRDLYYYHELYNVDESEKVRISKNLFVQYQKYRKP